MSGITASLVQAPFQHGQTGSPARLAVEIRRIRQRLASPDTLSHPRVVAELSELYTQVAAGLDERQGRHRRPVPCTDGRRDGNASAESQRSDAAELVRVADKPDRGDPAV